MTTARALLANFDWHALQGDERDIRSCRAGLGALAGEDETEERDDLFRCLPYLLEFEPNSPLVGMLVDLSARLSTEGWVRSERGESPAALLGHVNHAIWAWKFASYREEVRARRSSVETLYHHEPTHPEAAMLAVLSQVDLREALEGSFREARGDSKVMLALLLERIGHDPLAIAAALRERPAPTIWQKLRGHKEPPLSENESIAIGAMIKLACAREPASIDELSEDELRFADEHAFPGAIERLYERLAAPLPPPQVLDDAPPLSGAI